MFLPFLTFGLTVDLQIIVSTLRYKPVAFSDMPYAWLRPTLLALGITTLLLSIVSYIICFMMYGLDKGAQYGPTLFVLFLLKGLTWSPFTGMELYDTLFE